MTDQMSLFEANILPRFEQYRDDWLAAARHAARCIAATKGEITVNDVREIVPPPEGKDPRVMGAVFKSSEWDVVRYERSSRGVCHNRPIAVFKLRKENAA